jgi:hypothetical protein
VLGCTSLTDKHLALWVTMPRTPLAPLCSDHSPLSDELDPDPRTPLFAARMNSAWVTHTNLGQFRNFCYQEPGGGGLPVGELEGGANFFANPILKIVIPARSSPQYVTATYTLRVVRHSASGEAECPLLLSRMSSRCLPFAEESRG